jgi:hypothetical protein
MIEQLKTIMQKHYDLVHHAEVFRHNLGDCGPLAIEYYLSGYKDGAEKVLWDLEKILLMENSDR